MQRMLCGMRMTSEVLRPSLSEVGTRSAAERGERVEGGAAGRRIGGRAQGGGGGMRTLRATSLIVVLTALSQGSVRELPCTRGFPSSNALVLASRRVPPAGLMSLRLWVCHRRGHGTR